MCFLGVEYRVCDEIGEGAEFEKDRLGLNHVNKELISLALFCFDSFHFVFF